ncbi:hypothetical protein [Escherichia phage pEC-N1203-2Af.1]|nr:hypothetical protein [Escherichia phage pEC-N1203-2Af.1]
MISLRRFSICIGVHIVLRAFIHPPIKHLYKTCLDKDSIK